MSIVCKKNNILSYKGLTTHRETGNSISGMESPENKRYTMPANAKANSKTYSSLQ